MTNAPFGYTHKLGRMSLNPSEATTRRRLYTLFLEHKRKKTVAVLLTQEGHRTRAGKAFSDTTVGRLLRDPVVLGDESTEQMLDESVWKQCQELLDNPQKSRRVVHLGSGLVFCGACSAKMYVVAKSKSFVCQNCRRKIRISSLHSILLSYLEQTSVHIESLPLQTQHQLLGLLVKSISIDEDKIKLTAFAQ